MKSTVIKINGELPTVFCDKILDFTEILKYLKKKYPDEEKAKMKYIYSNGSKDKYFIDLVSGRFVEEN